MESDIRGVQNDPVSATGAVRPIRRRSDENQDGAPDFDSELEERRRKNEPNTAEKPANAIDGGPSDEEAPAPPKASEDGVGEGLDLIA